MRELKYDNKCIQYDKTALNKYLEDLGIVGSLSGLFSDSEIPLIHYRATENLFCEDINAINLARADVSVDAKLDDKGVGIKTFTEGNQKTLQKVAEFNGQQNFYKDLDTYDKIKKVAELRNKRIEFTQKAYGINEMLYHCVIRNKEGFYLFEEPMRMIDVEKIKVEDKCLNEKSHIIIFSDGQEEYKFDESKSTLYKRFVTKEYFAFVEVDILKNPIEQLRKLAIVKEDARIIIPEMLVLPLYSTTAKGEKVVFDKSGLNQWNANGRKRDINEVYIPYPAVARDVSENFFPKRNESFDVLLPNGRTLSMKVCQENGKAIMSNPNSELGKWILRDILNIPEGTVVTYDVLLEIGIDSVCFEKLGNKYKLNFKSIGAFENFLDKEYQVNNFEE